MPEASLDEHGIPHETKGNALLTIVSKGGTVTITHNFSVSDSVFLFSLPDRLFLSALLVLEYHQRPFLDKPL